MRESDAGTSSMVSGAGEAGQCTRELVVTLRGRGTCLVSPSVSTPSPPEPGILSLETVFTVMERNRTWAEIAWLI